MTKAHDHVLRWRGFDVVRWGLCAALIFGIHAVAVYAMTRQTPIVASEPPAAIVIELAPLLAAPASQETEVPPGPMMEQQPDQPKEPDDKPDEVEEEPVTEVVKPPEPEPEAPPAPKADVAVAEKQPDPPPEEKKPEVKPDPKPVEKPKPVVERKKPPKKKPMPSTTAPERVPQIDRAQTAPVSAASSANSNALPAWRSMIAAILERNKRYPAGARSRGAQGTATVRFAITRGGQLISASLSGGSGDAELDQEATALVRRIGSFPPPPAEIKGSTVTLNVPLRFNMR